MIRWLRRRREARALIERDADDLMARFGNQAYSEAGIRAYLEPETIDGNRSPGHWSRVKAAIAKRIGRSIGLSGWDQRAHN
jgi:hypothetical protein